MAIKNCSFRVKALKNSKNPAELPRGVFLYSTKLTSFKRQGICLIMTDSYLYTCDN